MPTYFTGDRVPYGEQTVTTGAGWVCDSDEDVCPVCGELLELIEDEDEEGHPVATYAKCERNCSY